MWNCVFFRLEEKLIMFSNGNIWILGEYNRLFAKFVHASYDSFFNLQYYDHDKHKQFLKFTMIGISKQSCFAWNEQTTLLYACNS